MEQLLPHPSGDRFALFQLVTADLLVLGAVCGASSLLFPRWSLPWACLPAFAVLVTLFGFSEGSTPTLEPVCHGTAPVLARSILFAIGLVGIAAWGQVHTLAATTAFTSSLTGLILSRWLRQFVWKRHQHESELRKILIVGGGPLARCIASTLRNDPLRRATICGFVDDDLPLSPAVLGRVADLDWLARAQFIDEVILVLPGQPARMREAAEVAYRNHLDIRAVPDLPRTVDGRLRRSHRRSAGGHLASGTIAGRGFVSEAGDRCNGSRTWDCGGQSCHGGRGPADPAGLAGFGYLLGRAHGVKGAASAATSFAPW